MKQPRKTLVTQSLHVLKSFLSSALPATRLFFSPHNYRSLNVVVHDEEFYAAKQTFFFSFSSPRNFSSRFSGKINSFNLITRRRDKNYIFLSQLAMSVSTRRLKLSHRAMFEAANLWAQKLLAISIMNGNGKSSCHLKSWDLWRSFITAAAFLSYDASQCGAERARRWEWSVWEIAFSHSLALPLNGKRKLGEKAKLENLEKLIVIVRLLSCVSGSYRLSL
jgi:hypothetical protein